MDDPRSFPCVRMCVRACERTCTHFRCRLIDAGRTAHTHRVNLRSVERFAASSSCFFFPRPFRSLSRSFIHARSLACSRLAPFARYRPLASFSPRLSSRFFSAGLTLLIDLHRDIESRYAAGRRSPYSATADGAYAIDASGKTRARKRRTRVKGGARDRILCS